MPSQAPEYFKAVMTIIWQAKSGKRHRRRVELGHVTAKTDFDGLAVLNIGGRGTVISQTVARAA
jgi:hypothetical protein